ncbi:MAG: 4a-hydroxytetrahydrobiopterin dehydratase [Longimicrobiales bacterium]
MTQRGTRLIPDRYMGTTVPLRPILAHPVQTTIKGTEGVMTELRKKKCKPCEGGIPPMTLEEAQGMQKEVPGWEVIDDGQALRRLLNFKNHYEVMAFANAVAWISHREDHHPNLSVGYGRCELVYTTHAVEGLTENDFICAAKVDALLE